MKESLVSLVFSDLFHERLHDGTTSNAQNHELERSRPVVMLKLNIIVTLSMMETNFATLHKKEYICHQNRKVANCFDRRFVWSCNSRNRPSAISDRDCYFIPHSG